MGVFEREFLESALFKMVRKLIYSFRQKWRSEHESYAIVDLSGHKDIGQSYYWFFRLVVVDGEGRFIMNRPSLLPYILDFWRFYA